jgi:hypothetical protein
MINRLNLSLIAISFFFSISICLGQDQASDFVWENRIYKEGIKTVLLYKTGWELSLPIIKLNSEEQVSLVFDEIGNSRKNYSYTIIHCNSDWHQSEIEPIDYLEGYETANINDYSFSQNTMVDYVNYRLNFPNEDCKPVISGNYIIKIFEEDDPSKLVLAGRFFVVETMTEISANVEKLNMEAVEGLNQRLNFNVDYDGSKINNPIDGLVFKIIKNNEEERNYQDLRPSSVFEHGLRYGNNNALSFSGGNEFRHLDTKSFKFLSDCLEKIEKQKNAYYVTVKSDVDKSVLDYKLETDLNGRSLIKLENNDRSNIMADYCYVNFELKAEVPIDDGNFYLFGDLSKWGKGEEYKMEYNQKKNVYEKQLFIKQGYYNYKYLFKPKSNVINLQGSDFRVEGNHFQAENDYHIFIYYKAYNKRYQELIGYYCVNSNK